MSALLTRASTHNEYLRQQAAMERAIRKSGYDHEARTVHVLLVRKWVSVPHPETRLLDQERFGRLSATTCACLGEAAIQVATADPPLDSDPASAASDAIANILHWLERTAAERGFVWKPDVLFAAAQDRFERAADAADARAEQLCLLAPGS